MREKSRAARKSFQQEAWIGFGGGIAARKCKIVNASDTGARLVFDDINAVPVRFKLKLTRTAEGRDCKVAWQRGREVGAEFV